MGALAGCRGRDRKYRAAKTELENCDVGKYDVWLNYRMIIGHVGRLERERFGVPEADLWGSGHIGWLPGGQ